jgi:hypothetical protein
MTEMQGQLPLFTLDGTDDYIQRWFADENEMDEICRECGQNCTSSNECIEFSGLYFQEPA